MFPISAHAKNTNSKRWYPKHKWQSFSWQLWFDLHIVTCSLQNRNADFVTVNNLTIRQPPLCNNVVCGGSTVHKPSPTGFTYAYWLKFLKQIDFVNTMRLIQLLAPHFSKFRTQSFRHMVICSWICLTDPPALGSASGSGWSSLWSSSSYSSSYS